MPNWASNTIRFESGEEEISKLKAAVTDDGIFDFNVLRPCPPELMDTVSPIQVVATDEEAIAANEEYLKSALARASFQKTRAISEREADRRLKEYGHTGWYDWCIDNWGTKWTGCEATILASGTTFVTIYFQSAWASPSELFHYLDYSEGITLVGGTIHEDGDEFELHGEQDYFDKFFEVVETEEVEDDYTWTSRRIDLK